MFGLWPQVAFYNLRFLGNPKIPLWRNLIAADVKLVWRTCKISLLLFLLNLPKHFQRKWNPRRRTAAVRNSIFHSMHSAGFCILSKRGRSRTQVLGYYGESIELSWLPGKIIAYGRHLPESKSRDGSMWSTRGVTIWKSRPKRVITPVATRITLPNNSVPCWMYLLVQNTSWDTEHFCPVKLLTFDRHRRNFKLHS